MADDDPRITVDVHPTAEATVVAVGGELEFGTAAALRATLSDLAQRADLAVVIDLGALRFIDSTGLSLLVQAKRRFDSEHRRFEIRDASPRVLRVFETSGLSELLGAGPDER